MIQEENTLKKAIEDTIKSNGKNNVKDDYTAILKFNNLLMGNDNFTPKFKMSQYYKTHYNEDKEFISNLRKDDKFKSFFASLDAQNGLTVDFIKNNKDCLFFILQQA